MRVVAFKTLREFGAAHSNATRPLEAWYDATKRAQWKTPQQVKDDFGSADFVGERVVFNIGGNKYRLIVSIAYDYGVVYIKFIGNHADYDKIDARTVEL